MSEESPSEGRQYSKDQVQQIRNIDSQQRDLTEGLKKNKNPPLPEVYSQVLILREKMDEYLEFYGERIIPEQEIGKTLLTFLGSKQGDLDDIPF
ncbi:hypothetical protein HN832_02445 [archaeon]|jgi:hypothetical protein|nr:hypothetical protein [archaeon]MBT4373214.1 hypothetical protein [archaeon]MBT4531559.1 hypothetical protein [archaeon]MBT7001263.1 hypothetical protein [archaeon]MBT7282251.1 hypothetical protein [archaeon]